MWGGRKTKDVQINMRHERALGIADVAVTVVSAMQWRVGSQQEGRGGYDVYLRAAECPRNTCRDTQKCFARDCGGLCEHMYWCTCPDDNTLCKHIHKVRMHSLGVRSSQAVVPQRLAAAATSAGPLLRPEDHLVREQAISVDPADAGSAIVGRGKRAQGAASSSAASEEPPASKQPKTVTAEWCADCWAEAQEVCGGCGHCLLALEVAEEDVQASLTAAHREMTRQQARLDALGRARARRSPVLTASVPHSEGNEDGWMVEGGSIHIALAATKTLTEEDKAVVCAALEDLDMQYEMEEYVSVTAYGDVTDGALDSIVAKLPACVEGQTARKGAVLLHEGSRLEVYFRDTPLSGGPRVHVFGHVQDGLDDMKAAGCDGKSYGGGYSQYGRYDGCRSRAVECYCVEGFAQDTTLSDVQFED